MYLQAGTAAGCGVRAVLGWQARTDAKATLRYSREDYGVSSADSRKLAEW